MDIPNKDLRYILSVDIGIKNLAFVLIECNINYSIKDIVWFELIDITNFCHLDRESCKNCKIPHSKTITDWLAHIFYLHNELFDLCELILVEKQPPMGHVSVEQIIFFNYRSKCVLISPRSVHKYFGWGSDIDYERRKEKSVQVFSHYLKSTQRDWLIPQFEKLHRKHDISDAYIQAVYFLFKKRTEYEFTHKFVDDTNTDKLSFLNKFYFQPYEKDIY